jgi:hypothetical protein
MNIFMVYEIFYINSLSLSAIGLRILQPPRWQMTDSMAEPVFKYTHPISLGLWQRQETLLFWPQMSTIGAETRAAV